MSLEHRTGTEQGQEAPLCAHAEQVNCLALRGVLIGPLVGLQHVDTAPPPRYRLCSLILLPLKREGLLYARHCTRS